MLSMDKEYADILGKKQQHRAVVIILFYVCTTPVLGVATRGLL